MNSLTGYKALLGDLILPDCCGPHYPDDGALCKEDSASPTVHKLTLPFPSLGSSPSQPHCVLNPLPSLDATFPSSTVRENAKHAPLHGFRCTTVKTARLKGRLSY